MLLHVCHFSFPSVRSYNGVGQQWQPRRDWRNTVKSWATCTQSCHLALGCRVLSVFLALFVPALAPHHWLWVKVRVLRNFYWKSTEHPTRMSMSIHIVKGAKALRLPMSSGLCQDSFSLPWKGWNSRPRTSPEERQPGAQSRRSRGCWRSCLHLGTPAVLWQSSDWVGRLPPHSFLHLSHR